MSSAHLQLAAKGQEDRWLSESPDRTYFEAKYTPRVNRSRETFEVPLDNQVKTFGMTGRCTIPVKGDYLTRLTLRAVFPPIYPTVAGEYVYPTPSSQVGASVYANMGLTLVVADGVTLTANTVGNHYMSVGAAVTLSGTAYRIFDLDGTYTVASIPTANSFTCSTTLAGISYNGTMSFVGIACGDIISYFSTRNSNLWVNNLTNKTWQITGGSIVGTTGTFTTSAPSNFPVGSQVILKLNNPNINQVLTVTSSTDNSFTVSPLNDTIFFVSVGTNTQTYSSDNGMTWTQSQSPVFNQTLSVAYGDNIFVSGGFDYSTAYSLDNGQTWQNGGNVPVYLYNMIFNNGVFYSATGFGIAYSSNYGISWTSVSSSLIIISICIGNSGRIISTGYGQGFSDDNGVTWTPSTTSISDSYNSVAFGNNVCVSVGYYNNQIYSTDNGVNWQTANTSVLGSNWNSVATNGTGTFVAVGDHTQIYSTDNGLNWQTANTQISGYWYGVTYGNNVFVAVGYTQGYPVYENQRIYSTDNGLNWQYGTPPDYGNGPKATAVAYGAFSYINSPSDSVSFVTPPLQLTNRVFSSDVYPSISFANASDAAFWGFDARNGLTYSLTAIPPWTLTQSGWVSGFLPPSLSTWDDSVAHKLVRDARVLIGKQTIKEYTGEYIELQNDLTVPYENKAILKLLNGTLDQTQATASREYYTTLPLGTKEIPLCALTHQQMSVEVDFEAFTNLSQNLNPGTGDFLNPQSYLTYDASTGILGGQPINVQTTFSYQQYIFIVTYAGQFIVYDTTKDVADPTSYIVLSAFAGTSLFSQFCVLSGNLYIGLSNGKLLSIIIDELIQGNTSSSILNNYAPTIGTLTGTIVADFRYLYYTVRNTASSNVFLTRYDTTGSFTNPGSYTVVDFTKTFDSSVTGVYQTLSTGIELIMIPQGTPGSLYTYQLNANVQSQWYTLDYSTYGSQITEGVVIGNSVYFICDRFKLLKYSDSVFSSVMGGLLNICVSVGTSSQTYSSETGQYWTLLNPSLSGEWRSVTYGNGIFVAVGSSVQAYSNDNGRTWNYCPTMIPGYWKTVTYGNGTFVALGQTSDHMYSYDGITWVNISTGPPYGTDKTSVTYGNGIFVTTRGDNNYFWYSLDGINWYGAYNSLFGGWESVAYGNGVFVVVGRSYGSYGQCRSTDNGVTWNYGASNQSGQWTCVAYGNGIFVACEGLPGGRQMYSNDYGLTWHIATTYVVGDWRSVSYLDGKFIAVSFNTQIYSIDGTTWKSVTSPCNGDLYSITSGDSQNFPYNTGEAGFKNLIAVGNYIYCSTSNVAVQIDTTQDLSTAAAYKYPAPVLPDGQYVFANGPRYIYMFSQSDPAAQNIVRFDPYPPIPTLQTSILVDYESLPPEVPKPDKALLGLVQTQKVTDMNYMNIRGPVKELWITGMSSTTNVFQYSNLSNQSTLALTAGEEIITEDVGTHTFLNTIEPFETHTSMPIRNVSVIPFELDPESDIPNGTVNFSRIRDQVFNGGAETVWARTYNLLAIQGGIGGLIFNS